MWYDVGVLVHYIGKLPVSFMPGSHMQQPTHIHGKTPATSWAIIHDMQKKILSIAIIILSGPYDAVILNPQIMQKVPHYPKINSRNHDTDSIIQQMIFIYLHLSLYRFH